MSLSKLLQKKNKDLDMFESYNHVEGNSKISVLDDQQSNNHHKIRKSANKIFLRNFNPIFEVDLSNEDSKILNKGFSNFNKKRSFIEIARKTWKEQYGLSSKSQKNSKYHRSNKSFSKKASNYDNEIIKVDKLMSEPNYSGRPKTSVSFTQSPSTSKHTKANQKHSRVNLKVSTIQKYVDEKCKLRNWSQNKLSSITSDTRQTKNQACGPAEPSMPVKQFPICSTQQMLHPSWLIF